MFVAHTSVETLWGSQGRVCLISKKCSGARPAIHVNAIKYVSDGTRLYTTARLSALS